MGLVVAQHASQDNILYLEQQNVVVAQLDFIQVNLHQIVKNVAKDHILQQDLQNVPYVKQVHIHHLMERAGLDITSGKVHLNPYENKNQIACTYCPFHSVCQFDPILEENNYRKLKSMKDKEVLEKIRVEVENDG